MTTSLRREETIQLAPVEFRFADDQPDLGIGINLFPHQKKLFDSLTSSFANRREGIYILTSMTGSGKTLANVMPAVATGNNAIFTYPTNALVQDQYRSITEDADTFGFADRLTVERLRSADLRHKARQRDENIPNILYNLFTTARSEKQATIFLTTPDTLYNIVAGRYWNVEDFSQPMDRGQEALAGGIDYVVFDEFHMYDIGGEVSMLNLATLLHHAERERLRFPLVFSSATSEEQLEAWLDQIARDDLQKFTDSEAIVKDGDHRIAGAVDLTLKFGPQWDAPDAFRETHDEERLRELARSGPVTAIFESATRTLDLVDTLKSETSLGGSIAYATGPKSGGPDLTADETKVQIGTRTLSVGIDFDTEYLFFESYRARDFLQKLGRVGRAADHATAIAYTSGYAFDDVESLAGRYEDRREFEGDLLSCMFQRRRIRSYAAAFGPLEYDWIESNFPISTAQSGVPPWGLSPAGNAVEGVTTEYARAFRNPGVPQVGLVEEDVRFQNLFDVLRLYDLDTNDLLSEAEFLERAEEIDAVAAEYVRRGTIRPVLFLHGNLPVAVSSDPTLRTERNHQPPTGLVQYTPDTVPALTIEATDVPRKLRSFIDQSLPETEPLMYVISEDDFDKLRAALPHLFRTYELQAMGEAYTVGFGQNALKLWSLDNISDDGNES